MLCNYHRNCQVIFNTVNKFEKRLWPVHDDAALEGHGVKALGFVAEHYKGLASMANFDLEEAKRQYKQAEFELRSTPFFSMDFKGFWNYASATYDEHLTGFS